jgi:Phosphopantetheine attachment site
LSAQDVSLDDFARLVGEVLGIAVPEAAANFFDLGGDSLAAAHLCVLAAEKWDLPLDPFAVIAAADLTELHTALTRGRPHDATEDSATASESHGW